MFIFNLNPVTGYIMILLLIIKKEESKMAHYLAH